MNIPITTTTPIKHKTKPEKDLIIFKLIDQQYHPCSMIFFREDNTVNEFHFEHVNSYLASFSSFCILSSTICLVPNISLCNYRRL